MQVSMNRHEGSGSYLQSRSPAELQTLLETLGPTLRSQVLGHIHGASETDLPLPPQRMHRAPQPRSALPTRLAGPPAAANSEEAVDPPALGAQALVVPPVDVVDELSEDDELHDHPPPPTQPPPRPQPAAKGQLAWRETPLLSTHELQALLPAVTPEARRWLREVERGTRGAAQQQRQLKELGRFAVRSERRCATAMAERTKLQRLAQAQSAQLVASARAMQAMRASWEEQQLALARETEKSRVLERGLRAMARSQQPV